MKPISVPWTIFRAYDIRGRAAGDNAQLTPELAHAIARTYGELLRERWDTDRAVIGGDQRHTTPSLKKAASSGLREARVEVVDIRRAPSPLVYWAAAELSGERATGGIAITASHNPPADNGIKLLEPGGTPVLPELIREIGLRIERGISAVPYERGRIQNWDPIPQYVASLAKTYPLARPLRIVVDPGNGVTSLTAARALRACGAEVQANQRRPERPQSHARRRSAARGEHEPTCRICLRSGS